MVWVETTATGGETAFTVELPTAIHVTAVDDTPAFVGGVKWPQSQVVVSDDRRSVTLLAPDDVERWTFAAGEVVEVGYLPDSGATYTGGLSFSAVYASVAEPVSVWVPSRAANATAGLDDPTYAYSATYPAVVEETDGAAQVTAYGTALGRTANLYASDAYRPSLRAGSLVKRVTGDVYRVVQDPVVPNQYVLPHCEARLEQLVNPPELTV